MHQPTITANQNWCQHTKYMAILVKTPNEKIWRHRLWRKWHPVEFSKYLYITNAIITKFKKIKDTSCGRVRSKHWRNMKKSLSIYDLGKADFYIRESAEKLEQMHDFRIPFGIQRNTEINYRGDLAPLILQHPWYEAIT